MLEKNERKYKRKKDLNNRKNTGKELIYCDVRLSLCMCVHLRNYREKKKGEKKKLVLLEKKTEEIQKEPESM